VKIIFYVDKQNMKYFVSIDEINNIILFFRISQIITMSFQEKIFEFQNKKESNKPWAE